MERFAVCLSALTVLAASAVANGDVVSLSPSKTGKIYCNEGTPDGYWFDADLDAAYPGTPHIGFGHGNRAHAIYHFDLGALTSTRVPGKRFVVSNASLVLLEIEALDYSGAATLNPILVDWVSIAGVTASWNNVELAGTGQLGHGVAVSDAYKTEELDTLTFLDTPEFSLLLTQWLNGDADNYGVVVRATANTPTSIDTYPNGTLSFSVEQVVPEPSTLALLCMAAFGFLAYGWPRRRAA